jgi:hypothetical protein
VRLLTTSQYFMKSLRNHTADLLTQIPIDDGGGCSVSKAYVMAYLIRRFGTKASLDIGVYRGRSLMPQALAHKLFTGGTAYGVDPWSIEQAKENDNIKLKEIIDHFLSVTDFEAIYQKVNRLKKTQGFENHCQLVRKTSVEATRYFGEKNITFDLIHIDGNHDTAPVLEDVELYLPLLKPEGFIVMDDVSWESVKPAYNQVAASMPRIFQHSEAPLNDYAVFWNTPSRIKSAWMKLLLHFVGKVN